MQWGRENIGGGGALPLAMGKGKYRGGEGPLPLAMGKGKHRGGGALPLAMGKNNIGGGGMGGSSACNGEGKTSGGGALRLAVCGSVRVLAFVCAYVLSRLYWAYGTFCYGTL